MAKRTKSIITTNMSECYLCGCPHDIEVHHIFSGTSNRKNSEEHGLIVPLCRTCHNTAPHGVHFDAKKNLLLKQEAQRIFEIDHTREEFRFIFGKSYLLD